jgi:hypothetical protein
MKLPNSASNGRYLMALNNVRFYTRWGGITDLALSCMNFVMCARKFQGSVRNNSNPDSSINIFSPCEDVFSHNNAGDIHYDTMLKYSTPVIPWKTCKNYKQLLNHFAGYLN